MSITYDFSGKSVLVTGAGSGIGAEAAARFVEAGAGVLAADLDVARVPAACKAFRVDVREERQVKAMFDEVVSERGRVDVVCNNAGIGSTSELVNLTVEEWDDVFAVNSRGVFLGCKYACIQMLRQVGGVIVNTGSVAGTVGLLDRSAYGASKAAVHLLTKQIAVQYASRGIRCNAVCPGTVDSPWVAHLITNASDPEKTRRSLQMRQPIGRLANPTEIANAICYLASDEASFITGSILVIDGGISAA